MNDLSAVFATLVRHHVATPTHPLPEARVGITWIWAQNGIFKRGVDSSFDILVCVGHAPRVSGLACLVPHARSTACSERIPGGLLEALLDHARRAGDGGAIVRPIEQQYFITYRQGLSRPFRLAAPTQQASAVSVRYEMPKCGQRLLDLHSHHSMAAYFSATDDRDDTGLNISAVVGRIFDKPEITIRANVYGHHQRLPPLSLFDHLPAPLCEARARKDDDADLSD